MEIKKYIQVKERIIQQGLSFEEIGIDEEPKFNSSVKGSQNYEGCIAIGIYCKNEGALFHYSYFPSLLKKNFSNYLNKIKEKENLIAKVNLFDGFFVNEEIRIFKEIFNQRNIPYKFLITKSDFRDVIFYPQTGDMNIFLSNGKQINL